MVVSFGKTPVMGVSSVKPQKNKETKNIRMTKQGNPYYHTNAAKKVGVGLGVLGGIASAVLLAVTTKNPKTALLAIAPTVKSIVSGLVIGASVDGLLNHNEKRKADQMAAFNRMA